MSHQRLSIIIIMIQCFPCELIQIAENKSLKQKDATNKNESVLRAW